MTDKPKDPEWESSTWEGSRKAQLRTALHLTIRQRLEALETLTETSRHFAQMRRAGEFHYGDHVMHEQPAIVQKVGEPETNYTPTPDAGRYRVHLHGCTPTPLASYLKALAILRLVAEQKDAEARGWWAGEHFMLESVLDEEGLKAFFLEEYKPTPIIAPWNGRAGFLEGENEEDSKRGGAVLVRKFSSENLAERFDDIRNVITRIKRVSVIKDLNIVREKWKKLDRIIKSKKKRGGEVTEKEKQELTRLKNHTDQLKRNTLFSLRNEAPDQWLKWFDACQVLAETLDEKTRHAPLLGKGGNDGSMDFGMNFMGWIDELFDIVTGDCRPQAAGFITQTIFGEIAVHLPSVKPGQFNPGGGESPNSGTGFSGQELDNPWQYIFVLEGALLFASASTKKLERPTVSALSFPFSVRTQDAGAGSIGVGDSKKANTELWLPLWKKPASIEETKSLFSEGRATIGHRSARNGLDFARAVSILAVNRGIYSFQRFSFLQRSGSQNFIAVPLGRYQVPDKPRSDLIGELDGWRYSFNKAAEDKIASGKIKILNHRLENTLFDIAKQSGDKHDAVQKTLILLGEIQRYAGTSPATQEKVPPVPVLSERWFAAAKDNSVEFRIAAALAGLQGVKKHPLPIRVHLSALDPKEEKYPAWLLEGKKHQYRTWHHGGLEKNLLAVLEKRLLLAQKDGFGDKPLGGWPGADLASIATFFAGETDDTRIAQLVAGLAHCRVPRDIKWEPGEDSFAIPAAFTLLKLVLTPDRQLCRCGLLTDNERLPVPAGLVRLLAADRVDDAIRLAQRRLRIAGISPLPGSPGSAGLAGSRLAAALLIPLTDAAVRYLHRAISQQDNKQALLNIGKPRRKNHDTES